MRKPIFTVALAVALFVSDQAISRAEDLSPEVKAQLCREKKAGLAKIEEEAPKIREQLAQQKEKLDTALTVSAAARELDISAQLMGKKSWTQDQKKREFSWLLLQARDARMSLDEYVASMINELPKLRTSVENSEQRQTEVGRQISLLRDSIKSLHCDTLKTDGPQGLPVDYGAIGRLIDQFQQSQPGGQTTTNSQSVVPQGPYNTPPPGLGTLGSTNQPTGQPLSGYASSGPYDTGSFQPPTQGVIQETIRGSKGGKSGGQPKNPCACTKGKC